MFEKQANVETHNTPMRLTIITVLLSLCLSMHSMASTLSINTVLKHTYATRSFGMGNAFTAIAEGEGSTLINPAGLSYPGGGYSFQNLDYESKAFKEKKGHFFYRKPIGITSIQYSDLQDNNLELKAVGLGIRGRNGISWGINYKELKGQIDGENVDGFSTDFGLLFRVIPSLSLGATIKDIYAKDIQVPTTYALGIAGFSKKSTFIWSADLEMDSDRQSVMIGKAGVECVLTDSLTLRSGLSRKTLYAGSSMQLPIVKVNVGLSNNLEDKLGTHYTLAFKLGGGSQATQYRKRYALFKKASYAEFSIGQNLKQGKSEISLLGGYKVGSNDLLSLIHLANQDKSCAGYIIRIGNLGESLTSIGLIEEIRHELQKGKENGKKIYIYMEGYVGLPEYYLASLGTVIVMPPMGTIGQFGLQLEIKKATALLEKLGIQTTVVTSGQHKASTGLLSEDLSNLDKEQLTQLVEDVFNKVKTQIQTARVTSAPGIAHLSDGKLMTAKEAKELDLVDKLAYWAEMETIIKDNETQVDKQELLDYALYKSPSIYGALNKIAVVEVDGAITLGANKTNVIFGGTATGADDFETTIKTLEKDWTVKGVILRINSPGGSVLAADRMYESLLGLKKSGKLLYTSMGSMAASGGYYIASNSDRIYANDASLTGSIGVLSSLTSFSILGKELGITHQSIKTGKYMDLYSSLNRLSEDEKQMIQAHQDNYYQEFVQKVKQNRQLTEEEAYTVSQGQLFTGTQAKNYKIVDKIGSLYEAVDDMKKELDLDSSDVVFVRKKSGLKWPFSGSGITSKIKDMLIRSVQLNYMHK